MTKIILVLLFFEKKRANNGSFPNHNLHDGEIILSGFRLTTHRARRQGRLAELALPPSMFDLTCHALKCCHLDQFVHCPESLSFTFPKLRLVGPSAGELQIALSCGPKSYHPFRSLLWQICTLKTIILNENTAENRIANYKSFITIL